jgi:hypothetical protein
MKPREIGLLTSLVCLIVLNTLGSPQHKRTPKTGAAESQVSNVNTDFDGSRILKLKGRLREYKGQNLRVVGFLFAIYEQQEGGAPLWQEVQNVELDDRGNFLALVGSSSNGGIPPELFTGEKMLWLGEQVLVPDEAERPRMRLISTPAGLLARQVLATPGHSSDQPATGEMQEGGGKSTESSSWRKGPGGSRRLGKTPRSRVPIIRAQFFSLQNLCR